MKSQGAWRSMGEIDSTPHVGNAFASLFIKLKKDSHNWANEEEVRKSWLKHIENELGITFHAERGRNDASHNQVIIEFKSKGLFKGSTKSAAFKEAVYDRLEKYIRRRMPYLAAEKTISKGDRG